MRSNKTKKRISGQERTQHKKQTNRPRDRKAAHRRQRRQHGSPSAYWHRNLSLTLTQSPCVSWTWRPERERLLLCHPTFQERNTHQGVTDNLGQAHIQNKQTDPSRHIRSSRTYSSGRHSCVSAFHTQLVCLHKRIVLPVHIRVCCTPCFDGSGCIHLLFGEEQHT